MLIVTHITCFHSTNNECFFENDTTYVLTFNVKEIFKTILFNGIYIFSTSLTCQVIACYSWSMVI